MKLMEIIQFLETNVPLEYQEGYDNSGLLVGDKDMKVKSVLTCLDCTEAIIQEAISRKCNLIISHHPILFNPIKKLTNSNYSARVIFQAIQNDIAIYSMHTNLDNIHGGVSFQIANKIFLENTKILKPKTNLLTKLSTYCPTSHTDEVKNILFSNGAGRVGPLYDRCSFVSSGMGSFRPLNDANPFSGQVGKDSLCKEDKIEVVFCSYLKSQIISALKKAHPYQEVAYTCSEISNESQIGSGVIGELKKEMDFKKFIKLLKKAIPFTVLKHTKILDKKIKKVAVCGGSGSFLLQDAIFNGADIYISSDFKYHDFFDSNGKIIIADIGHYETEQFVPSLISEILKKKFHKLDVILTKINTNPISYY